MRVLFPFIPPISLGLAQGVNLKQCFFPNGDLAAHDYPCDPSLEESACCGPDAMCLTNKLCRMKNGNLVRGTCTDRNWNSLECALFCLDLVNAGKDLISCSNVTGTDTAYCCEGGQAFCCDTGIARFEVSPPNPQPWAKWDDSASSVIVYVERTSAASSSSSISSSTDASTSIAISSIPTTPTTIISTTPTAAVPTSVGDSITPSSTGLPVGAQAGIGVGAGVVVILLLALGFLLRKLRQNKYELKAQRECVQAMMAERGPEPPVEYGSKTILDGTPRSELNGGYEYHGYGGPPLELPATPRRP